MLNAKKCLKAGSILFAGTMLLSVFPMMTLAKPAIEVITHAGVSEARRAEMEAGMMKAMKHSLYQAYLMNSGLDETSPQPSGPWGEQIRSMVGEFGPALKEMGLMN